MSDFREGRRRGEGRQGKGEWCTYDDGGIFDVLKAAEEVYCVVGPDVREGSAGV